MLQLSLFEGKQKRTVFMFVPLNANELLLLSAQGVELQQLVSGKCKKKKMMLKPYSDSDGEIQ